MSCFGRAVALIGCPTGLPTPKAAPTSACIKSALAILYRVPCPCRPIPCLDQCHVSLAPTMSSGLSAPVLLVRFLGNMTLRCRRLVGQRGWPSPPSSNWPTPERCCRDGSAFNGLAAKLTHTLHTDRARSDSVVSPMQNADSLNTRQPDLLPPEAKAMPRDAFEQMLRGAAEGPTTMSSSAFHLRSARHPLRVLRLKSLPHHEDV